MNHAVGRHWIEHLQVQFLDLRIVIEQSCRLKRIQEAFSANIVDVASPPVRGIQFCVKREPPREFCETRETAHGHHPVLPTGTAYQHARPDVAVVVVYAWRPGEVELYRAHGAAPEAAFGTETAAVPLAAPC